jgi:hypothetical protein
MICKKPFPSSLLQVNGAALRIPDVPPESAWPIAREKLEGRAAQDFAKAAGGQHYRSVVLQANYTDLNWTQLFLPLFVSYYTADDGQRCPVYINGQTGTISGVRLASQRKGLAVGWHTCRGSRPAGPVRPALLRGCCPAAAAHNPGWHARVLGIHCAHCRCHSSRLALAVESETAP